MFTEFQEKQKQKRIREQEQIAEWFSKNCVGFCEVFNATITKRACNSIKSKYEYRLKTFDYADIDKKDLYDRCVNNCSGLKY